MEPKTRYGASPAWSNTFQILQPVGDSSMALTEAQRFDRSHLHRTLFQKEESDKKRMHTEGRLEAIRTHRNIIEKTIEENTSRQESKITNSLKKKAIEQILYEKVNKRPVRFIVNFLFRGLSLKMTLSIKYYIFYLFYFIFN